MIDFGTVRPGTTLRVDFATYSSDDPTASMTITGLAVTDIEVYKAGTVTQRSSDAGYALIDTDGIDIDGITGIHGFTIDLADNTDAGFYAAGQYYSVVVSAITLDGATINFIAARFRIGQPGAVLDTTIATLASQTSFTLTAGPAEDDALNGMWVVIHDVASAVQFGYAVISDYTGSTKTVTLAAGTTFTAAATDNISIMGPAPLQPAVAGRTLGVEADGDLTKVNTLDGHTPQTGDSFARIGATGSGLTSLAQASVATEARLAELDAANLPTDVAAVKTDTGNLVTRITATLFSGITALKEWLGAIAGKQAADATALTEIRGTGAGAGTYDPTTDSNEALRDTAPMGTAMRGTDGAALASDYTAGRAAKLDNLDAAVTTRSSHSAADVWSAVTRTLTAFSFSVTVGTNNDKTGYALSAAGVQAIWDALTSALTTAGSVGKLIVDNVNATISSRAAPGAEMALQDGAITAAKIASAAITAAKLAAGAVDANALAADAATEVANAVKAAVIETAGSYTIQQALSVMLATLAGVTTNSGATLKTPDGSATRVAATVNASQERTAMTLTPSS